MKEKILPYLRILLISLTLLVIVGAILLIIGLFSRWDTSRQFSDGFFMAGAIFALLGLFSAMGGFRTRGDFKTVYSESAGDASLGERTRRLVDDLRQGYKFFGLMVLTAALLVAVSILIGQFA